MLVGGINENEPPEEKRKLEDSVIDANSDRKLTYPETESIISGRKLSDLHINFAQQLLKKQFPNLVGCSLHSINKKQNKKRNSWKIII